MSQQRRAKGVHAPLEFWISTIFLLCAPLKFFKCSKNLCPTMSLNSKAFRVCFALSSTLLFFAQSLCNQKLQGSQTFLGCNLIIFFGILRIVHRKSITANLFRIALYVLQVVNTNSGVVLDHTAQKRLKGFSP